MTSLPPKLLNELLAELSTLASVYHKPAATFIGHGKYGADAIQRAAIQEQRQNAMENPIAAAVASAANGGPAQNNAENLLDIDFDGAAPASAEVPPARGASGLEGLAGTPQRVDSPAIGAPQSQSNMDDMMGLFGGGAPAAAPQSSGNDLMSDFAGLSMDGMSQPPPPQEQLSQGKKTNDDLLGMF